MARTRSGDARSSVDPGLQQERTSLAWRRTSLSLLAAVLIVLRLTVTSLGAAVLVPAIAVGAAGLWLLVARLRAGRFAATSAREPAFEAVLRDGRLPAAIAFVAASLCLAELVAALAVFR